MYSLFVNTSIYEYTFGYTIYYTKSVCFTIVYHLNIYILYYYNNIIIIKKITRTHLIQNYRKHSNYYRSKNRSNYLENNKTFRKNRAYYFYCLKAMFRSDSLVYDWHYNLINETSILFSINPNVLFLFIASIHNVAAALYT